VGKTKQELGISSELIEAWEAALRKVFATGRPEEFELAFPVPEGTRHFDCRVVPELGPRGDIQSVLSVARDMTERRLAFEAEQRARIVADALREATVALTRSLDRETVLSTLLEHLRGIVPFDRASVMLLEEARRVSVRAIFDGDRVVPLPPEARSELDPADHPIVNSILTTGSAVLIPDVRTYPGWSLPTDGLAEASWLGVPLFARGDVAGLFSLSKREAGYFNEGHVKLAEAMSSQASVAVENAILFQQMEAATVRMRMLSRGLIEAQESERRSLSRELHDEAGQALASLRYGLQLLEREVDGGENVTERLVALRSTTDAIIEGLRRLAADLRPASLDHLGLEAALRQLSQAAGPKFGLEVHFKARGFAGGRLPSEMETALYRVVQEAMSNVVRHARATRVDVLAERRGDRVMVMVEDDGAGFDQKLVQRGNQLGLVGMHERIEALSGTLTVESAPGAGTTIVVEVPIADSNPDR
jgi:signal transduction histidine kinase